MGDILFLAHRVPYPPDRGDKIRSFHLLRHLARLARVHLVAFAEDAVEVREAEALRPMVRGLHLERRTLSRPAAAFDAFASGRPVSLAAFDSPTMRATVARLLATEPIDTIFAFSGQMAQFVPNPAGRRFVMDFVDVDSAKYESYARTFGPMRWLYNREARLLGAFEREVAARADASLFVSQAEADLFIERNGLPPGAATALENGIDLDYYDPCRTYPQPSTRRGPLIVFTGQMDYRPNVEAVTEFARRTMPMIRAGYPDAQFVIVGRKPGRAVCRLAERPGVIVTGEVPDVRVWLAAADVVVAPLRLARGIQNKVLEAMAMARPVVASAAAFEGIDAEPWRDLVIADPQHEAEAVIALLDDPARAHRIGRSAREQVEARYGWDSRLAPLAALVGRERQIQEQEEAA